VVISNNHNLPQSGRLLYCVKSPSDYVNYERDGQR